MKKRNSLAVYLPLLTCLACQTPVPDEYQKPYNQELIKEYREFKTIPNLQCDAISKFEIVLGPGDSLTVSQNYEAACPVNCKVERYLSNGSLDKNNIQTSRLINSDTLAENHKVVVSPVNEYFKVTVSCEDRVDGNCSPGLIIRKRKGWN